MRWLFGLIVAVSAIGCDGERDAAMPPVDSHHLRTHTTAVDAGHAVPDAAGGGQHGAIADHDSAADSGAHGTRGRAPRADAGTQARDAGSVVVDAGGSSSDAGSAGSAPEHGGASVDAGRWPTHAGDAGRASRDASSDASANAHDGGSVSATGTGFTYLNDADRGADVFIESDRLSAEWRTLGTEGVRSTRSIAPGEGVFYYEARLPEPLNMLSIGVATAAAPLDQSASANDQSFGIDTSGGISVNGVWSENFESDNVDFGFVLDYRAASPIVHVIALENGQPVIVRSQSLAAISKPLFIYMAGIRRTTETHVTINPGNDTTNAPFVYAPAKLLRAAGLVDTADTLVMGWGATHAGVWNAPPTLTPPAGTTVPAGTRSRFGPSKRRRGRSAQQSHRMGGDVDGQRTERAHGKGATFTFTPKVMGIHPVRMTVTDSGGKRARQTVDVVAPGSLAQYSNVRMTPDAKSGSGIVVSPEGLRVRWTANGKNGIRANQALYGAFWYFEAQRLCRPSTKASAW